MGHQHELDVQGVLQCLRKQGPFCLCAVRHRQGHNDCECIASLVTPQGSDSRSLSRLWPESTSLDVLVPPHDEDDDDDRRVGPDIGLIDQAE